MTYEEIGAEIGRLVHQKQIAYGDSFGNSHRVIEVLFPFGIPVHKYQDALTLIRIIDKLFRVANSMDAFGEDPYKDIAGYAILAAKKNEERKNGK